MERGEKMNAGVNVGEIIFLLVGLGVPIIFIVILSLFWSSPKKRNKQSNHIDNKLTSMEKRIKKWMDYRD